MAIEWVYLLKLAYASMYRFPPQTLISRSQYASNRCGVRLGLVPSVAFDDELTFDYISSVIFDTTND